METEKVIFRSFKDPYDGYDKYMAIFPEDAANLGNVAYVDIWKDNNNTWWHDCYGEIDRIVARKYQIVHKTDPICPELIDTLKKFYGGNFKVVEKITERKIR